MQHYNKQNNRHNSKQNIAWEPLKAIISKGFNFDINTQIKIFKFKGLLENFADQTSMKSNQIRKIFNELKKIERKYKDTGNEEELKKALVFIYPKIAYGKNRKAQGGPLISKEFAEFLRLMLDNILNSNNVKKDFKMFMQLFEGFVGFVKRTQ